MFDLVSHGPLLSKLRAYGFSGSPPDLTKSYLGGRKQHAKIGKSYSDWRQILLVFLSGPFPGPLLFNKDLTYFVIDANLKLCADNTMQYSAHSNPNVLEFTTQNNGMYSSHGLSV